MSTTLGERCGVTNIDELLAELEQIEGHAPLPGHVREVIRDAIVALASLRAERDACVDVACAAFGALEYWLDKHGYDPAGAKGLVEGVLGHLAATNHQFTETGRAPVLALISAAMKSRT